MKAIGIILLTIALTAQGAKPLDPTDEPFLFQVTLHKNGQVVGSNLSWKVRGNKYLTYQESTYDLVDELKAMTGFVNAGDCYRVLVTWPRDGLDSFWVYGRVNDQMELTGLSSDQIPECE